MITKIYAKRGSFLYNYNMKANKTNQNQNSAHQADFITTGFVKSVKFAKSNAKAVIIAVVAVLAAAGGILAYYSHQQTKRENMWADLFEIQLVTDAALRAEAMESFIQKFDGKTPAALADIMIAEELYGQDKYEEAVPHYRRASASDNDDMNAFAQMSLIAALYAGGESASAVEEARKFVETRPMHFGVPQAYQYLAMGLEKEGKADEAAANYKILFERYPGTYYATFAQNKLKK